MRERGLERPPTRWRRSGETVSVTDDGPTGRLVSIADWQSPSEGASKIRITGSVMGLTSSVYLSYWWAYVLRYRVSGLWVEESAPWACQGWVRTIVCDEAQVHARQLDGTGYEQPQEGGPWLIGAGIAGGEGAPNRVSVPLVAIGAENPSPDLWYPVRPPVGTTRVRLDAESYDGYVGFADDVGGIPVAGLYVVPGLQLPAAQFAEWRTWDARYGLISYAFFAQSADHNITRPSWIFEVA